MLLGIDISNHNYKYIHDNGVNLRTYTDFVLMKASEGRTYKDPYLDYYYDLYHGSKDGRPDPLGLYGFYHYARPEYKNDPKAEAENFLKYVGHHAGYCMFALDVEGNSLKAYRVDDWAREWLDVVFNRTGVRPMLYTSESAVKLFQSCCRGDYGLWVAKWNGGVKFPKVKPWSYFAMWQFQSTAFDYNWFNGDLAVWRSYCMGVR